MRQSWGEGGRADITEELRLSCVFMDGLEFVEWWEDGNRGHSGGGTVILEPSVTTWGGKGAHSSSYMTVFLLAAQGLRRVVSRSFTAVA